jgi:hypothetical protein
MQIALILFAILTIIGSFSAWRRSPLYSLKTTLKLIGAFVGIVAVTLAASWAVLSGPLPKSPVAQAILAIAAILALSIGAMVTIIRITDSHVAQLPPNVRLVTLSRHRITVWIWRFLVFLLVMGAASLVAPGDWYWLPSGLGGFMLLICGPLLAILYMMARRYDRAMTAVMANPWIHWQYTPEQWLAWAEKERGWETVKEKPGVKKGLFLSVLLCVALFGLGSLFSGGNAREKGVTVAGLTGMVVLMLGIVLLVQKLHPGRRYRHVLAAPPETWIGDEGLFSNGDFWPWILSGRYLLRAGAILNPKDEPGRLVFVFQSFTGNTSVEVERRVLIQEGGVADLALLQRKLSSQCPKAVIRIC